MLAEIGEPLMCDSLLEVLKNNEQVPHFAHLQGVHRWDVDKAAALSTQPCDSRVLAEIGEPLMCNAVLERPICDEEFAESPGVDFDCPICLLVMHAPALVELSSGTV